MEKKKLPTSVQSIVRRSVGFEGSGRAIGYILNFGSDSERDITIKIPTMYTRPKLSEAIIDANNEFVNGFKRVQLSNGEYGYIRESDNALLPFRYDIAFDFNEYGFAMVGKGGVVSWIDSSFRHLNSFGKMVNDSSNCWSEEDGWLSIDDFSKGKNPLSHVYGHLNSYFSTDGKLKKFYCYDGKTILNHGDEQFPFGTSFNEFDYAISNGYVLFARGYYMTYLDVIKFCQQYGALDALDQKVTCETKDGIALTKKIERKPNQ